MNMHKDIKRFHIDGVLRSDSDIPRMRQHYEALLRQEMIDSGYVELVDIVPAWTTEYNDDTWVFMLSMFGVYCGKKKARQYTCISDGKLYRR